MTMDLFRDTHRSEMPLTSDYVFRAAFGRDRDDSRAALMAILNIILDRKNDPIRSIEIKNPIDTAEKPSEKETVMDVRAETNQGEQLDIEMQAGLLFIYPNRVFFYGGRLVNSSLQKGEEYDTMKKSIVVSIINGKLFPSISFCHNIFEVRECNTGLLHSDRLSFHFLELGKVNKDKPISGMTCIEKLAFYLKYANDEEMKDYVDEILAEEGFAMAKKAYSDLTKDEIEFQRMESRIRDEHHRSTELAYAHRKGEDKMKQLNLLLIEQNRIDDLQKASSDIEFCQRLYQEFGLE